MHLSSLLKFEAFLDTHLPGDGEPRSILDVGSAAYGGHATYRAAAERRGLRYVGLDMQAGDNVDVVSANPVVYDEVASESHDFVVSGQTFEHNPFFWVSFCEMARILKPGGRMIVIAPSSGQVHRFPFDCWRFYPDSWMALCAIAGMEREETIFEPDANRGRVDGAKWRDSAVVARKPDLAGEGERAAFLARIAGFTAPFRAERFALAVGGVNDGAVFARYAAMIDAGRGRARRRSRWWPFRGRG